MAVAATGFAVEVLLVLTTVGFGLVAIAMPRRVAGPLLFAPVVGLAVALLANQWLTWFVPAPAALLLVLGGGGSLTLVQIWRLRSEWASVAAHWRFGAAATAIGLGWYLASLGYVFRSGTFTLAGYADDAIKLYAPTAQWFTTHPVMPGASPPVSAPILGYIADYATRTMPGSVGTVPSGLSVLTGWPVHALFDPLQGILVLLIAIATAALVRAGAGFSAGTALIAFAAVPASALLEFAMVAATQQQLETMSILYGGLALAMLARRDGGSRLWFVAAITLAALPGAYLPVALLALVILLPVALGLSVRRVAARRFPLDRGLAAAIVAGLVLSAPSLAWILLGGGVRLWILSDGNNGGVTGFFSLPYYVGIAPVTRLTTSTPISFWRPQWDSAATTAAIVLVVLAAVGLATLLRRRHVLEVAAVAGALVYLASLGLVVRSHYGFFKTTALLTPVVMGLAAIAVLNGPSLLRRRPPALGLIWPRALPTGIRVALGAVLAGVVVMQAGASVEEQMLARGDPAMEPSATGLTVLRTLVPHGARILIYDPHDWTAASLRIFYRYEAAAYVLTGDASVDMVVEGPLTLGSDPLFTPWAAGAGHTTLRDIANRYDYVLTGPEVADQVPRELHPVWMQADLGLELFKRGGVPIASGGVAGMVSRSTSG